MYIVVRDGYAHAELYSAESTRHVAFVMRLATS